MRKTLLAFLLSLIVCASYAQQRYFGFTADYNSGIGERYTYGLGMHLELQVTGCDNLYFNWHYTLGSNTHSELYFHAPLPIMLYRTRLWWDTPISDLGDVAALLIAPVCCPSGMTYYLPAHHKFSGNKYRFGMYLDPLSLDVWQMNPHKVTSWTIDSGIKCIISTRSDMCFYFSSGVAFTNNVRRGAHGFGNEALIQVQVGILNSN